MRRKNKSDLGTFHREAAAKGLTYAEAQMQETCEIIGRIRAPRDKDAPVYQKMSAWKTMRRLNTK